MKTFTWIAAFLAAAATAHAQELEKPVRLEAAGRPIETETGHAHPFVYDFDRDGVPDLLVGQFGGGKLRIYRNTGTAADRKFADVEWFQAGGALGTVPAS